MAVVHVPALEPIVDDPDDYRPNSRWALVTDPGDASGRVDTLIVIVEEIGVGERIPLHRHQIDELLLIEAGEAEVRLGTTATAAGPGTAVFIPAGAQHGTTNVGDTPVSIRAVFASPIVEMESLERNPAPGTEDDPPAHTEYDARTGEFRILNR